MREKMFRWPEDVRGQLEESGSPWWFYLGLIGVLIIVLGFHKLHNFWVYFIPPIAVLVFPRLIWKKMHPFHIPFFMHQRNPPIDEWDDAKLKVLSYLASTKAKRMLRRTERVIAASIVVISLADCLIFWRGKPLDFSLFSQNTPLAWSLGGAFLYFFVTLAMQDPVVFGWVLRHFDEIQRNYPPWPKDVPFDTTKPPESLRLGKIGDAPLGDTS